MLTLNCFSRKKQSSVFISLIFAKEVLHIFEKDYPSDMRPRKAIESVEAWLNDRTEVNAVYAAAARAAARAAADSAAYAAYVAAYAAADAAAAAAAAVAVAAVATNAEYIHQILFKNLSSIFDFHIKEGTAFEQPEVVFQYLNDEQKERFVFEVDILC